MSVLSAICTVSLGRAAYHSLSKKLEQASAHGFQGIELFAEDLWTYAEELEHGQGVARKGGHQVSHASLIKAALNVRELCKQQDLAIICLQPMSNYEGHADRAEQSSQLHERAPLWFSLVKALGTDLIQVPSSYKEDAYLTNDFKAIVSDVRDLADSAGNQDPPIRIMYEALAWGTRADMWQQSWEVVKKVDRSNCGICLDTFNIAARVYGDPTHFPRGTNGLLSAEDAHDTMMASMHSLVNDIPVDKVFLIEVADGERLDAPLVQGHEFWNVQQPPRMSWSRNCRLFYGESDRGAFLPIKDMMQKLIDRRPNLPNDGVEERASSSLGQQRPNRMGYRGWISQEVFSRSLWEAHECVPEEHAMRARQAWQKLVEDSSLPQAEALKQVEAHKPSTSAFSPVRADPLTFESVDYDPVTHLNAIFSHSSTLSSAPAISYALRDHRKYLDGSLTTLESVQNSKTDASLQRIREVQSELASLFKRIDGVRERAIQTEQTITEMTADIKRLDGTKRNLTLSMTMLKRLQMLTTAYEQLRGLGRARQYRECAQLLQAVVQLMAHFKSYRSIDQIATLGKKVADLQRELLEQVCEDFEVAFSRSEIQEKKIMLAEGCVVTDALGENAKARLVTWYCNNSLREYRQIFRGNDEAGSLDNISRRYAWLNRMLKTYDHEHASVFPLHWRVNEMLANSFCQTTREDFKGILQESTRRQDAQSLNVNLLLSCLQETLDFEQSLERRFANESRRSTDTTSSVDDRPLAFQQAISEAFEPYLSLWVEAQDRQLASTIPKYRSQPLRSADEDFTPQLVIHSSTELFQLYRLQLAQCAKLSTGTRLQELTSTFGKYLDQYAQQVLFHFLSGQQSGEPSGPPLESIIIVLNTADYCYVTTTQLEEKIRHRIDADLKSSVDLQSQADAFMGIAGACVRALIRKVEFDCEAALREMRNTAWAKLESVGDQSSYVPELLRALRTRTGEIISMLQHKQQYARTFCDNLVETITNDYISTIGVCRPIGEVGAEQLLLDTYALKKLFTDLPTLDADGKPSGAPAQQSYAKRVANTTSKIDPLLKTLQVRPTPPEALVQAYLIHIADRSEANFKTVLELKGVTRKQEQNQLVEIFNAHKAGPGHAGAGKELASSNPVVANLNINNPSTSSSSLQVSGASNPSAVNQSSIPGMPSPNVGTTKFDKFDPASFGSALLSAAKDGVDRFQIQTQQGSFPNSANPSRVTSPPVGTGATGTNKATEKERKGSAPANAFGGGSGMAALMAAAGDRSERSETSSPGLRGGVTDVEKDKEKRNLNDNLRNIGRFFRLETGR
ncbi:MAG: Vacuolar protein sorting-associated protein 53 [Alyxoria varia]|nr:MAG: Vacuolar protein sorting-associated protein 53 [Alyxoria varia]